MLVEPLFLDRVAKGAFVQAVCLGFLIGLVVPDCVLAHPTTAANKIVSESESDKSLDVEGILISDHSPGHNSLPCPQLYLFFLGFRVNGGNNSSNNLVQSRTDIAAMAAYLSGQRKRKVVGQRKRLNVSKHAVSNVVGWRMSLVDYFVSYLELESSGYVLRKHHFENRGQVGPALEFGDKLLPVGNFSGDADALSNRLNIAGHRDRNSFHGAGRSRRLRYGSLDVLRLPSGNFVHFRDRASQHVGLDAEHYSLNQADYGNSRRNTNHPPIGRRLIEFGCLDVAGFVLSLFGWQNLDENRRLFSAAFIATGLIFCASGWLLWWITFYSWSWGWRL